MLKLFLQIYSHLHPGPSHWCRHGGRRRHAGRSVVGVDTQADVDMQVCQQAQAPQEKSGTRYNLLIFFSFVDKLRNNQTVGASILLFSGLGPGSPFPSVIRPVDIVLFNATLFFSMDVTGC